MRAHLIALCTGFADSRDPLLCSALAAGNQTDTKNALMTLVRESRKTKDRRHAFSQF